MKKHMLFLYVFLLAISACTKYDSTNKSYNSSLIEYYLSNDSKELEFTTAGQVFTPVLGLKDGTMAKTTVLWSFADGTTSGSLTPSIDYGSSAVRVNKLKVTPWSSLRRINIGYDAGDGGSSEIEYVDNNYVITIANLYLVKAHLIELCVSHNPLTSLDIHDFVILETLECYHCSTLDIVNLNNTPNLKRICFEQCNVGTTSGELNLSSNTKLEDLRAAGNIIQNLILPPEAPNWWHFCAGGGNHFNTNPDFNKFSHLRQIWVGGSNLTGNLVFTLKENLSSLWVEDNPITGLDLSKAAFVSQGYIQAYSCLMTGPTAFNIVGCTGITGIDVSNNALTFINLTGQTELSILYAHENALTEEAIEHILSVLDSTGVRNGTVDLTGNTLPNSNSLSYAASLVAKGWTVSLDD